MRSGDMFFQQMEQREAAERALRRRVVAVGVLLNVGLLALLWFW